MPTSGDLFGDALAVGDFDGDGFDDLAIGAPGEGLSLEPRGAGSVNALYGSAARPHRQRQPALAPEHRRRAG